VRPARPEGESTCSFHNDGGGRFTDVSVKAGVSDPKGYFASGSRVADTNADGWPDLYVGNDSNANFCI
jgi:hypothetical protein